MGLLLFKSSAARESKAEINVFLITSHMPHGSHYFVLDANAALQIVGYLNINSPSALH